MQREVFARYPDPDLRVYVVWVPKSRGLERDVAAATTIHPEARARHYWDAPSVLVEGFQASLGLPEDAWDLFLLYGPGARWESGNPPAPEYWAHQLGSPDKPRVPGPWLDGRVFLEKLTALGVAR
jgi:hypothetical protein